MLKSFMTKSVKNFTKIKGLGISKPFYFNFLENNNTFLTLLSTVYRKQKNISFIYLLTGSQP